MQQFINRRKKWIRSNLYRNKVNKLGYFPAYYLHKIKKILRNQLKNILYSSFAEEIRIKPCVLIVFAVYFSYMQM